MDECGLIEIENDIDCLNMKLKGVTWNW